MEINVLSEEDSIFNHFLAELRDKNVQKDSMRFRRNLERTGEVFAYEISKRMRFSEKTVETPLGEATTSLIDEKIVLATVLRAGLPLHQGMLNFFDGVGNAFVSAFRKPQKSGKFEINVEYISSPPLQDKVLIISDAMLATGRSMALSYESLVRQFGKPAHTHVVSVVASYEGVEHLQQKFPENTTVWLGAIDHELTVQAYIVPGLGDAGDLAFGTKK